VSKSKGLRRNEKREGEKERWKSAEDGEGK
jgi:hypothetical protein